MENDRQIERSGEQRKAELAISLSPLELKLLSVALDSGATDAEAHAASSKFVQSLRARGVVGSDFDSLLEMPEEEVDAAVEEVAEVILDSFQILAEHVINNAIASDPMENLFQQFRRQALFKSRV
jgi:hypothetical protein